VEKDWSERFERNQPSQRPWLIVIGVVVLFSTTFHLDKTTGGYGLTTNPLWPLYHSKDFHSPEVIIDYAARVFLLIAGISLIASGIQKQRTKLPPEP
jgi:hypothetical protein